MIKAVVEDGHFAHVMRVMGFVIMPLSHRIYAQLITLQRNLWPCFLTETIDFNSRVQYISVCCGNRSSYRYLCNHATQVTCKLPMYDEKVLLLESMLWPSSSVKKHANSSYYISICNYCHCHNMLNFIELFCKSQELLQKSRAISCVVGIKGYYRWIPQGI